MDIADEEIIALWKALHKYNVQYIMIGGFATNMHGYYRTTSDVDVWIKDTKANRGNLGIALEELEISTKEIIERYQFIPGWTIMNLASGFPLDIMTKVKGLENIPFEECLEFAMKAD